MLSLAKSWEFLKLLVLLGLAMAQENYDTIIRNAKIIDGTGTPWFKGDLGLLNGELLTIGSISNTSTAGEIIDANLNYIAPGFIDSHTHDDIAILESPVHEFKVVQGVTTIVTGNCGFSNYPEGHLQIVQDHLSSLLGPISANRFFQDFSSLNASLIQQRIGVNVAPLVGHGPLRLAVVGYENRNATQQEILDMCELLDKQLEQGALGLSLGLVYPPSSYAALDELISLAEVVKKHNRVIAAHVRSYEGGLLSSVEEFVGVLRASGARGLLSHLQAAGTPYWNTSIPQALEILEKARLEYGIDVMTDMYPYLAGSSTILQLLPPSAMSGGIDELLRNIETNATFLENLKNMTEGGREPGWESKIALIGYENIQIGSVVNINLKRFEGLSVTDGAILAGLAEFEFLLFIIKEDMGMTNVIMFQQYEPDNYLVFQSRLQMIGSDSIPRSGGGKPHPRGFGTFPRVIGHYALQEKVLSLEEAVRKSTSVTANRFGILGRGLLVKGYKADLVMFSEDIMDQATYEDPTKAPTGIKGVWVNGVRVIGTDGGLIDTNLLPGTVIHNSQ